MRRRFFFFLATGVKIFFFLPSGVIFFSNFPKNNCPLGPEVDFFPFHVRGDFFLPLLEGDFFS